MSLKLYSVMTGNHFRFGPITAGQEITRLPNGGGPISDKEKKAFGEYDCFRLEEEKEKETKSEAKDEKKSESKAETPAKEADKGS